MSRYDRTLRYVGGPWDGMERKIITKKIAKSIPVPGHPEGRYTGWPSRYPMTLVWTTNKEAW